MKHHSHVFSSVCVDLYAVEENNAGDLLSTGNYLSLLMRFSVVRHSKLSKRCGQKELEMLCWVCNLFQSQLYGKMACLH